MKPLLYAALLLSVSSAFGRQATMTTYSTTWNGFTRTYSVYLPPVLAPNPALVMALHGTVEGTESDSLTAAIPECESGMAWAGPQQMASGYVLICPVATWKLGGDGIAGYRFWESYNTADYFPTPPDDTGFLRSLILQMERPATSSTKTTPAYGVDPHRVFVTGMSSGGMMSERVGIDSGDLVAAIAPVASAVWVGHSTLPLAKHPLSVLELHGDADELVSYCGSFPFTDWGETKLPIASIDDTVDYWLAADGFARNPSPLCVNGAPSHVYGYDARNAKGVEVQEIRMIGYQHVYYVWMTGVIWQFLSTHSS